eukprot:c32343_g1_i1.p1 GENE.c32343_g1_i1~~c32343_g1_i1.p1  ORF type:complete len:183 (+),score=43.47 c32343_g1_i1:54-602(+)
MIKAVLVVNIHGKARLSKFYEAMTEDEQQRLINECYNLVKNRTQLMCNFIENVATSWGKDSKIIYRSFATLFFIFVVDSSESDLGILDLIHAYVESLDACFENVSELDIIFHSDKCHFILDETIMGGLVFEISQSAVADAIKEQNALEKEENVYSSLDAAAVASAAGGKVKSLFGKIRRQRK